MIQQNCRNRYKYIISALEAELGLNTGVICIQEPFLEKKNLVHAKFDLYWPARPHDCKDNHVFPTVR